MQYTIFPEMFKNKLRSQMNIDIMEEKKRSQEKINSINAGKRQKSGWGLIGGCLVGGVIGFFSCWGVCFYSDLGIEVALGTLFYITMAGIGLGVLFDKKEAKKDNAVETKVKEDIEKEKNRCNEVILQIQKKMQEEYEDYKCKFEQEVQRTSVRFADSELASQVIDWMTQGFSRSIDAADRRSHVETIYVPFSFNVYRDKIVCNIGTFDFQLHRCRFLNNPLEQEALAHAITSGLRLQITMKYPKDLAGCDIRIDMEYTYGNSDYVVATVTYIATNGNYTSVRNW